MTSLDTAGSVTPAVGLRIATGFSLPRRGAGLRLPPKVVFTTAVVVSTAANRRNNFRCSACKSAARVRRRFGARRGPSLAIAGLFNLWLRLL
jgi:hypothetical protein